MFRDSRGVVHTVSSADPLTDVPPHAAAVLARALLVPDESDLGTALERCEAVIALLDGWQDAFFAALPEDVDLEEERRYAQEMGVPPEEVDAIDADWDDPWGSPSDDDEDEDDEVEGQLDLDVVDLDDALLGHAADPLTAVLDDGLVHELERDLLLLPMRVRLEALMAAGNLVVQWAELLGDQEKCLGHLILAHGTTPEALEHEALAALHARLHDGTAGHA